MFIDKNKTKGFGLIELIIAVAIIAILGGGKIYWDSAQNKKSSIELGKEAEKKAQGAVDLLNNRNPKTGNIEKKEDATQIDISTWKTYRNEKYGFMVKYSPGWTIKETKYGKFFNFLAQRRIGKFTKNIEVDVFWESESFKESEKEGALAGINTEIIGRTTILLDNVRTEKILKKVGGNINIFGTETKKIYNQFWEISVARDALFYNIHGAGYDGEDKEYFNAFVSTFKFLK